VSESALRAAIAKKLPFKCEIMICPARDIIGSGRRTTVRTGHHAIRQRGGETNCNAASTAFQPPVGG
jgi:hypothetical protein